MQREALVESVSVSVPDTPDPPDPPDTPSLRYNNKLHGISGRANQKDWAIRMQQFFDTKLKGTPAPDWMIHGIPAKDKGKDVVKKVTTT